MKRRSSLRTTLAPMPSTPMSCPPDRSYYFRRFHRNEAVFECWFGGLRQLLCRLRDLHAVGRIEHRLDNVVVAGAAADIAFQLVPDSCLVELAAIAVHD